MRTYTEVGKSYSPEDIDNAISRNNWESFRTTDLPFSQGECIKQVIRECKIPVSKISRMDLHNSIRAGGENHAFYALDVKYANGQAQIYIADDGCGAVVVASDFIPVF